MCLCDACAGRRGIRPRTRPRHACAPTPRWRPHRDRLRPLPQHTAGAIVSGSWDRTVKLWDPRRAPAAGAAWSAPVPDRVFGIACVGADTLVVATAGRRPLLYDVRRMAAAGGGGGGDNPLVAIREAQLKHPTRVVRGFPDGTGWATGSTEGRVAVDFLDPSPAAQAARFAFKCHRQRAPSGEERVFPVHAIAFHPGFGTFATGEREGARRGGGVGVEVERTRGSRRRPRTESGVRGSHGRVLARHAAFCASYPPAASQRLPRRVACHPQALPALPRPHCALQSPPPRRLHRRR